MFLELHHVGDYTIFSHNIMNYLTSIKAAWHKKKFDICICIKLKNCAIRPSIVQNQKSYCTSECSTKSYYTSEYSIKSNQSRTVCPSAVQN